MLVLMFCIGLEHGCNLRCSLRFIVLACHELCWLLLLLLCWVLLLLLCIAKGDVTAWLSLDASLLKNCIILHVSEGISCQ